GLLVDQPDAVSLLHVELRDPGVDMTTGARPRTPRHRQPLTRLVRDAVENGRGADAEGYRDYRGVPVLGAWTWLPEYGLGVGVEQERGEALRPLYLLRMAFWGLLALLAVTAAVLFVALRIVQIQRRLMRQAGQVRQVGAYTLEEKLGSGGMGTVYKAR